MLSAENRGQAIDAAGFFSVRCQDRGALAVEGKWGVSVQQTSRVDV